MVELMGVEVQVLPVKTVEVEVGGVEMLCQVVVEEQFGLREVARTLELHHPQKLERHVVCHQWEV
jgi:hypothetical protein